MRCIAHTIITASQRAPQAWRNDLSRSATSALPALCLESASTCSWNACFRELVTCALHTEPRAVRTHEDHHVTTVRWLEKQHARDHRRRTSSEFFYRLFAKKCAARSAGLRSPNVWKLRCAMRSWNASNLEE